jgi:hypothetical protein
VVDRLRMAEVDPITRAMLIGMLREADRWPERWQRRLGRRTARNPRDQRPGIGLPTDARLTVTSPRGRR